MAVIYPSAGAMACLVARVRILLAVKNCPLLERGHVGRMRAGSPRSNKAVCSNTAIVARAEYIWIFASRSQPVTLSLSPTAKWQDNAANTNSISIVYFVGRDSSRPTDYLTFEVEME
jgi:hypothetical protein